MQLYSYLASVQVDLVPCLFWTIPIWHWYQERCWVWCWLLPSLLQENVKEGDKKCTIEDKMPPAGTCHVLSCLLLGKSSWCDTRIEPPCVTERTNEWVWNLVFVISVCSNLSHTRSDKFVQNQRYGLLISASRFWQWLISIRISGTDAVPSSIFMYFRDWRLNHQTVATLQTNSPMWFSPFLDHEKPCVVHMENPIESPWNPHEVTMFVSKPRAARAARRISEANTLPRRTIVWATRRTRADLNEWSLKRFNAFDQKGTGKHRSIFLPMVI